jgi:hypothetical protein
MESLHYDRPLCSRDREAGVNTNPLGQACKVFFHQNQILLAFGAKKSILRIEKLKRTRLEAASATRRNTVPEK